MSQRILLKKVDSREGPGFEWLMGVQESGTREYEHRKFQADVVLDLESGLCVKNREGRAHGLKINLRPGDPGWQPDAELLDWIRHVKSGGTRPCFSTQFKLEADKYRRASEGLEAQTANLAAVVDLRVKDLLSAEDIDGLQELADELPRGYKGTRRIYQAIIELEDKKALEAKPRKRKICQAK